MLDIALLGSVLVIVTSLYIAARWAPVASMHANEAIDRLYLPTFAAILAARVVAAALDDPTSLRSLRSLLVVRGGLEFWPGVAAGLAVLAAGLRRSGRPVLVELVDLAPFALWGYGAWELTCWLRDGCYGPEAPFGLVPDGLSEPQLPMGLLMGGTLVLLGFVVRHAWSITPGARLLLAVGGAAAIRAVGSFWLPHLGAGLTRQHWQSLAVVAVATFWFGLSTWQSARVRRVPLLEDKPGDVAASTERQRP